jgi:hypothetical protein
MPKVGFILFVLFFCGDLVAQIDSSDFKDHSLYLYRTEADFFNKNKIYRGQYMPDEDLKVIRYKTADAKKRVLNLNDSCSSYFGYQIGDEIRIRPDKNPNNSTYYVFGGGTPELYCVVYGSLPNYDKKGFLLGLTSPAGMIYMYFIDKASNQNMVQLHELLKLKPKLLEQYQAEKAKSSKQDWERRKLTTGIKYLKLMLADQK